MPEKVHTRIHFEIYGIISSCGLKNINTNYKTSFSQVRLPPNTSDDVDEDPTGNKALWDRGLLNGASQKVKPSFR